MTERSVLWEIHVYPNQVLLVELHQVETFALAELDLPVWQAVSDQHYNGSIVRYVDLPPDLAKAFDKSQDGATIPFPGASYLHDFASFVGRKLRR